jgi:metal-dependent hydrolase (beta-lactamase superfamily II)
VTFTVVYDNNPYAPGLRAAWGFACWVQTPGGALLFDTGGDGPTLLGNLAKA